MPDQALAAGEALVRVQRERVHTSMLIELLVLLVFLAMAFAFVRDGERRLDTMQEELERQRQELKAANSKIAALEAEKRRLIEENASLERSLRRFMSTHDGTLLPNDQYVMVRAKEFSEQVARSTDAEQMIEERQAENATLRQRLAQQGKGGSDLPRCAVSSGSFVLQIDLLGNGSYLAKSRWSLQAQAEVAKVPGLTQLASSGPVSEATFRQLAGSAQAWGKKQPTPCGFYVEVFSRHSNLSLYKRQYRAVGAYFYPAMR